MRYRLRTLMIVLAIGLLSVLFARVAYLKYMAHYYREWVSNGVRSLAIAEGSSEKEVRAAIALLAVGDSRPMSELIVDSSGVPITTKLLNGSGDGYVLKNDDPLVDWYYAVFNEII